MRKTFLSLIAATFASCLLAQPSLTNLRCEGMRNPLGIDNTQPHFSWQTTSHEAFVQTAFELEIASDEALLRAGKADVWRSGKVKDGRSVMMAYNGKPLQSRQMYYWRVKAYGAQGETCWSDTQRFSVGIVADDRLHGSYIGLGAGEETAVMLRRDIELSQVPADALLYVCSLGYHEAYVNGQKVSEEVLVPAVSQLDKRSRIVTYDVSRLLRKGTNDLVLWIGSGWYKKRTFKAAYDGPLVAADLDVRESTTWRNVAKTDPSWKACVSGYRDTGQWGAWQMGGERMDARVMPADMTEASLAAMDWQEARTAVIDTIAATPQMCTNNIVKETIVARSVEQLADSTWLIDMGKVLNGFLEIHLPALPRGTEITAAYSDHLQANGDIFDMNSTDQFVASGRAGGDTFRNRFNHHCFRYVRLSGLPVKPVRNEAKALRIGMNVDETGTFVCSDTDLNSIHQMMTYTMDCLMFSGYMVDCAHIERLGYGGDGNASTLSLQNMFDVAPLYMNWLQAWNDAIRPDGGLPHTAPNPYSAGGGPYWCSFIVQAPWRTWMNYGDDRLLHRCYDSMKLWLTYVDAHTRDGLLGKWPNNEYRNWYLGDWLAPRGTDVTLEESVTLVNNCALVQSYNELVQIAAHLGKDADMREFELRREKLSERIHEDFYHAADSTYATGSQLDLCYPLLTGVVPEALREAVTEALKRRTATIQHGHLGVGLVGIPVMAEWATKTHQADFIYQMLKQPDYPGYLYMLRNGATATWEDWDKPRSYLHNCFNGMDSWFVQALGGIVPLEPGYRKVSIDPQQPNGLDWVRVSRETPYGSIIVHWTKTEQTTKVHVVIPNGVTAIVDGKEVGAGTYDY